MIPLQFCIDLNVKLLKSVEYNLRLLHSGDEVRSRRVVAGRQAGSEVLGARPHSDCSRTRGGGPQASSCLRPAKPGRAPLGRFVYSPLPSFLPPPICQHLILKC